MPRDHPKYRAVKRYIADQNGFTLMELVVTITLTGILLLVVIGIIGVQSKTLNRVSNMTMARWELRKAMKTLRSDIQMIRPENLIYSNNGRLTSGLLYFRDLNGKTIRYCCPSNNSLQKKIASENWTTLLSDIQQHPFQYFDKNLSSTHIKEDVHYIGVTLKINYNGVAASLRDRFYVRN